MEDVYQVCPQFENGDYLLRLVTKEDAADLWKVYSDEKAVPFFNGDNCHGDDFHYRTLERMEQALDFWFFSYSAGYFVRWAIVEKKSGQTVGTIELFHRDAQDAFTNCGLLRLDLRSDQERVEKIQSILSLILEPAYALFTCDQIATKAIPAATERIEALKAFGFVSTEDKLVGEDGTEYPFYFVKKQDS